MSNHLEPIPAWVEADGERWFLNGGIVLSLEGPYKQIRARRVEGMTKTQWGALYFAILFAEKHGRLPRRKDQ